MPWATPNTSYLSPEGYKHVVESYESDFEGIGAWVREQDGRITVQAVMEGAPAEDAGLLSGDVLLEVDGQPSRWIQRRRGRGFNQRAQRFGC